MKRLAPLALLACSLLMIGAGCSGNANVDANGTVNTPPSQPAPKPIPPAPTPTPAAEDEKSVTFAMNAQNGSGESGTATLTATTEGKTQVVVSLTGTPKDVSQPAHIHLGTCVTLGAVSLPLESLVNGSSTTLVDVSLASLLHAATKFAINVHKSEAEITNYVACGDIAK